MIKLIDNPVPWPNGAKCAVAFTFDIDTDSPLHLRHLQEAPQKVNGLSILKYDEVAVPRILKIYKEFNMKQTFFIPAWVIENYPEMVNQIVQDGHEIGHHGYLHEHPNELPLEEERYWFEKSVETIKKLTGKMPKGYRAPLFNPSLHTIDLLIEKEFLYESSLMADDIPYYMKTEKGKLIELPIHWGVDDWPQYGHFPDLDYMGPVNPPEHAMSNYMSEFMAAYENGGMFLPVWHGFASGRLARMREVYKLIEYMHNLGDVWFATTAEIAEHVKKVTESGEYQPRVVEMPYYKEPIKEINDPKIRKQG